MPAQSKAQRRFMAMCEHHPQHAEGKCPDMTKAQLHEFATTKEKGLPQKKTRKKSLRNLFGNR